MLWVILQGVGENGSFPIVSLETSTVIAADAEIQGLSGFQLKVRIKEALVEMGATNDIMIRHAVKHIVASAEYLALPADTKLTVEAIVQHLQESRLNQKTKPSTLPRLAALLAVVQLRTLPRTSGSLHLIFVYFTFFTIKLIHIVCPCRAIAEPRYYSAARCHFEAGAISGIHRLKFLIFYQR